ncbi:hypothetical protein JM81_1563 [Maribacter sp. MAR_2009_72]|nr:hypothetical protein JM81_1563 [Maribacter sp. MAR_2009_72]
MELQIKIIGGVLILLALIHIIFPRYFNWKEELNKLSLVNKQIMTVHTIFIALTVLLMGLLCLTSTKELIETNLGKTISFGFAIFWTIRLFIQFFGYSTSLWNGKTFETIIHVIFSVLWFYLSGVFWLIYFK